MAVQKIVEDVLGIIKEYAPKYEETRSAAHKTFHTRAVYAKKHYTPIAVNLIIKAAPQFNTSSMLPKVEAAVEEVWKKSATWSVFKSALTGTTARFGLAKNEVFNNLKDAEKYSGQDALKKRKKKGGQAAAIENAASDEVTITLLNCYKYNIPTGESDYMSDLAIVTNRLTFALAENALGVLEKGKKKQTSRAAISTAEDEILSGPITPTMAGEHHTKDSTIAGRYVAAKVGNDAEVKKRLKALSATAGKDSQGDTALDVVMKGLEARVKVLDVDKMSVSPNYDKAVVVKEDILTVEIRPAGTKDNEADWDSKGLNKLLQDIIDNLATTDPAFKGSKPYGEKLTDAATAIAVGKIIKGSKKNLKWKENKKVTRPKKINKKSNAVGKIALANKGKKFLKKYVGKKVKPTAAMKSRVQTKAGVSPIALRNLLNTLLPRAVASKMTGGRTLQFRTGRFAGSAEVTNVVQGAKGGMQIDYTYMKYPYQTFEPGFAQGSTFRDPRLLIGQSIRELATQIMQQKFTGTVRRI